MKTLELGYLNSSFSSPSPWLVGLSEQNSIMQLELTGIALMKYFFTTTINHIKVLFDFYFILSSCLLY